MPPLCYEDIRRLDVAMHDPFRMRSIQRIRHLNSQVHHSIGFQRPSRDEVLERGSFQIFHDNEGLAVFLANVVNGADVGMVQGRSRLRLALKTAQRLRIAGDFIRQELERNKAVQPGVFRLVHHPHAAAQLFQNPVVRNNLLGQAFHPRKPRC